MTSAQQLINAAPVTLKEIKMDLCNLQGKPYAY